MKDKIETNANEYQVFFPIEEWERLKRLDEKIKEYKQQLLADLESPDSLLSEYGQKIVLHQYELLDSLYKEDNK